MMQKNRSKATYEIIIRNTIVDQTSSYYGSRSFSMTSDEPGSRASNVDEDWRDITERVVERYKGALKLLSE